LCKRLCEFDKYQIRDIHVKHIEKVFLDIMIFFPEHFRDRLLDQIVICVIVAVMRIYEIDVKFKHIINYFKKNHYSDKVWSKVFLKYENGKPIYCKDIIEYYNQTFATQTMENYLLQQPKLTGGILLSEANKDNILTPNRSLLSPQKNQRFNVTVSPRRNSNPSPSIHGINCTLGTPEIQKVFNEINSRVNKPATVPRAKRKLFGGSNDEPEDFENKKKRKTN